MKKNLIIIGGGFLQTPLIHTALDMGLHLIVFDMSPEAPGMALAQEPVIMSTRDIEGCVRTARRLKEEKNIHGVITAGTDASRAVAAIAGSLELPGIRYADAEAASNKVLMRKRLLKAGVPIPGFFSVWSLKEARDAMDELNFPLVIKPADNMGARGVVKIQNRGEISACFKHAKKYSPTGEMILEEFMEGPELSIDALAWDGQIKMTGIADRIIAREPYFVELGHNMPSALPADILDEAEHIMRAGMRALGIHTGAGKGDLKVTPDGVKVGEIAARLSGGFMSSHTYPLHSGVNLLKGAIQIALGEEPRELTPPRNKVAIERGILTDPGKILVLEGKEDMESVDGIEYVHFSRKPGDIMLNPTSNLDKVGHIVALGDSLADAENSAERAREKLRLLVDETFSVDWKEVETRARNRFGDSVCWVCKACDGANCASGVPGMGGVGNMNTFRDNSLALAEYKIIPRYIREPVSPDTSLEFLGRKFESPIMAAPMTGAITNMKGAIDELSFSQIILEACRDSGSLGWVGDGASPEKYKTILEALDSVAGFGISIFKPRADEAALIARFQAAAELPVLALGMDIDAISFKTMALKNQSTTARPFDTLKRLRDQTTLPFVLKGIMSPEDASLAIEAGVDAIVISNHGGRILDDMPGTARVLPGIAREVGGRIPVLVDGGIRSGMDVFKMLALGADAVLIGRPIAIAAVGGEIPAIKFLLNKFKAELKKSMNLCGIENLCDIDAAYLHRINRDSDVDKILDNSQ